MSIRKRVRNRKKKVDDQPSMIGKIIDLPFEDFKKELVIQKVNVGTMNNLILNLSSIYQELRMRKDKLIELAVTDSVPNKEKDDIKKAINGLYAEMTKVEQKITYLKETVAGLMNVG